ncbi:autoinducer binding domain-containing protein [Pseudomonas sp. MH2]|uniref:Autoinducer binding domain-containing protein n=1 Tax=Pseudomonas machongensis TaxID=3110229 RepID=A0ABU5VJD3_9PSED|nr:autoinducer binding domain-containing protein [Pseudomonas sp. MH2]MEA5673492.1 autoinducer binding domain-containing protein [Pseudomonas sp. MH2]
MLDRTAEDWQRLGHLPTLLEALPALVGQLGFRYSSFSFASCTHAATAGNLLSGSEAIIQAALDLRPHHLQGSNIPLIWEPKAFATAPLLWAQAQRLGLRHGWLQPLHEGAAHSCLALLRPHVSVSTAEHYQNAATALWLAEFLHRTASQSDAALKPNRGCV